MGNANLETKITIRAKDLSSKVMRGIKGSVGLLRGAVFNLKTALVGLGGALLVKSLVATASEFENLRIQLNALQGSSEAGRQALAWVKDFAKTTPLSLQEVTRSFVTMRAFGLDPMDGSMLKLVDTSSKLGGGVERLTSIVRAVGQMFTKGKIQAEEMNRQLTEVGVPAWDLLSKAMNKNIGELQDMASKGQLGRKEILLLIDAIGEFGQGAALANMQTFSGLWSNFMDQVSQGKDTFAKADRGLFAFVKGGLEAGIQKLAAFRDSGALQEWGKGVGDTMLNAAKSVLLGAVSIRAALSPIFTVAAKGINAILEVFNGLPGWMKSLGLIGAILLGPTKGALVIAAIGLMTPIIDGLKRIIRTFKGELGSAFDPKPMEEAKLKLIELAKETEGPLGSVARILRDIEKAFENVNSKSSSSIAIPQIPDTGGSVPEGFVPGQNPFFGSAEEISARLLAGQAVHDAIFEQSQGFEALAQAAEFDHKLGEIEREREHQEALGQLILDQAQLNLRVKEQEARDTQRIEQMKIRAAQAGASAVANIANALFIFQGEKSKSMFKVVKAFNIAQATVDALASYNRALNDPTPMPTALRFALAASAVAAGLANVARISQTTLGGGVGGAGGGSGGTTSPSVSVPSGFPSQQNQQQQTIIHVNINALDPESVDMDAVGENLAVAVANHVGNGGSSGQFQLSVSRN